MYHGTLRQPNSFAGIPRKYAFEQGHAQAQMMFHKFTMNQVRRPTSHTYTLLNRRLAHTGPWPIGTGGPWVRGHGRLLPSGSSAGAAPTKAALQAALPSEAHLQVSAHPPNPPWRECWFILPCAKHNISYILDLRLQATTPTHKHTRRHAHAYACALRTICTIYIYIRYVQHARYVQCSSYSTVCAVCKTQYVQYVQLNLLILAIRTVANISCLNNYQQAIQSANNSEWYS